MRNFRERRCRACGGTFRLVTKPGRRWRYKHLMLEVPADFGIPTCDRCGDERLEADRIEALHEILSRQYADYATRVFATAIDVLRRYRSQRALEHLLGLSQGYISKILSREKVPSATLVNEVVLLAKAPVERLGEVEATWSAVPEPPAWLVEKLEEDEAAEGT
jgi:hypothetical protein